MTGLSDYLIESAAPADEPSSDEERETWRIDGPGTATWALRKLARCQQQIQAINDQAYAEQARIEQWRQDALAEHQRDAEFFEGKLCDWHRRTLAEEAQVADLSLLDDDQWKRLKGKTRKLPAGNVSARRTPASVEVSDEDNLVDWALLHEHFELLRVTPAKSELKKLTVKGHLVVTDDGEVVPGVVPTRSELSLSVKPDLSVEQPAYLPNRGDDT